MTQQLREALKELSDHGLDAPTPQVPPAHDLWLRGRRARKQRIVSSVLVVGAVLALLGAVLPGVGEQLRTTPSPASYDEADLAIPDNLWSPSSWGPTVGPDDPPGPLAAIGLAPRRRAWLVSSTDRWFGVSAVDQQPRWLDLPGRAASEEAQAISLSPDGKRLAYALGGEPTAPEPQSDVVGLAVLDLVTGEVTERVLETRFGLRNEHLVWSGDSRWLVAAPAQFMRMLGASRPATFEAWDPATGEVTPLPGLHSSSALGTSPTGVAAWGDKGIPLLDVDPATGEVVAHAVDWWWDDVLAAGAPVFGPDRSMVVWRDGWRVKKGALKGGSWPELFAASVALTGELGRPERAAPAWLPGKVLGWSDPRTVLVDGSRRDRPGSLVERPERIVAIDVQNGQARPGIGRPPTYEELHDLSLAADLLERPLAEAGEPVWKLPLWLTATLAVALLGIGLGLARRARSRSTEPPLADGSAQ